MLILKGDISITNNISDLDKCRFTHKIILIGEPDKYLIDSYGAISGSIFMPPYEAVMQEMDGNVLNFNRIYFNHLTSTECQEYIALIFRAMYEGKKILLYLTKDESELMYSKALIEYLAMTFGLMVSPSVETPAGFNSNFSSVVSELLYLFDLFKVDEFLLSRLNEPFSPMTIQKLVMELNPYVTNRTIEEYNNYFMHLQQTMCNANRPVRNGLVFEEN